MQEDGVGTAVESIYRNLEYARSLIKRRSAAAECAVEDGEDEELLAREPGRRRSVVRERRQSGYSSSGSVLDAQSEDWSVISDDDGGASPASPRRGSQAAHS